MLKHIYVLKEEYKDTDLYIWDVGKRSIWIFTYLAYRGIDIRGFITDIDDFAGGTFMNRPVISAEEFSALPEGSALMVLDDETSGPVMELALGYGKGLRMTDILEFDPALSRHAVWVYGTGNRAWKRVKQLEQRGASVEGFFVSEQQPDRPDSILGRPVVTFTRETGSKAGAILVAAGRENSRDEILLNISAIGYDGDVYIKEVLSHPMLLGSDPFIMIDRAMKENKDLLLCSEDAMTSGLLRRAAAIYGAEFKKEVCFEGSDERGLEDIYALADEDPDKSVLLIHSYDKYRRFEMAEAATDLGYTIERGNFESVIKACYNRLKSSGVLQYEYDEQMMSSVDYTPAGGLPGLAVHGDPDGGGKRILVYGGSTSSEVYAAETWASQLQKRCAREGKDVVVFNGAQEMDTVEKELRRLLRDIGFVKPDIVISMSGVNNLKDYSDKFARSRGENQLERWKRTERYMKLISESEGARFYAFLQPMNMCMQDADIDETRRFTFDTLWHGEHMYYGKDGGDLYTYLVTLFHHKEGMFIDFCHYTEEANGILADAVYEKISEAL